jgi:hypothetical protein
MARQPIAGVEIADGEQIEHDLLAAQPPVNWHPQSEVISDIDSVVLQQPRDLEDDQHEHDEADADQRRCSPRGRRRTRAACWIRARSR